MSEKTVVTPVVYKDGKHNVMGPDEVLDSGAMQVSSVEGNLLEMKDDGLAARLVTAGSGNVVFSGAGTSQSPLSASVDVSGTGGVVNAYSNDNGFMDVFPAAVADPSIVDETMLLYGGRSSYYSVRLDSVPVAADDHQKIRHIRIIYSYDPLGSSVGALNFTAGSSRMIITPYGMQWTNQNWSIQDFRRTSYIIDVYITNDEIILDSQLRNVPDVLTLAQGYVVDSTSGENSVTGNGRAATTVKAPSVWYGNTYHALIDIQFFLILDPDTAPSDNTDVLIRNINLKVMYNGYSITRGPYLFSVKPYAAATSDTGTVIIGHISEHFDIPGSKSVSSGYASIFDIDSDFTFEVNGMAGAEVGAVCNVIVERKFDPYGG